ncbi:hypothetical protein [Microbacterium sp. P04]|uniref:hypothetical protein n=1 Tax=Microbacterium sp. P04 TaxID=3366947 RepID=UPI003745C9D5
MKITTYKVKSARPLTASELEARTRLKEMAANQLSLVRRSAERWRTGAGISGGAVAVAALLTAPEVLKEATQRQLEQGLSILTVTVVLAIGAIGFGLRASIGWPALANIASASALHEWEGRELRTSMRSLRVSMVLSVLTVAVAALAGAILLFGLDITTFQLVPSASLPSPASHSS